MNCHSDSKDFIFAQKKRKRVGEGGREGRKRGRKGEGGGGGKESGRSLFFHNLRVTFSC